MMTDDRKQKAAEASKISLIEESATVAKHDVQTGKVRIRTVTEDVEEVIRTSLHSESFEITRVPINRAVDAVPQIRTEGDVTIVPVLEEVLFVEKRLMLKEEIHLKRRSLTETTKTPVMLRRQRAVVDYETLERGKDAGSDKQSQQGEVK